MTKPSSVFLTAQNRTKKEKDIEMQKMSVRDAWLACDEAVQYSSLCRLCNREPHMRKTDWAANAHVI